MYLSPFSLTKSLVMVRRKGGKQWAAQSTTGSLSNVAQRKTLMAC